LLRIDEEIRRFPFGTTASRGTLALVQAWGSRARCHAIPFDIDEHQPAGDGRRRDVTCRESSRHRRDRGSTVAARSIDASGIGHHLSYFIHPIRRSVEAPATLSERSFA
jgi:hypothetical protein